MVTNAGYATEVIACPACGSAQSARLLFVAPNMLDFGMRFQVVRCGECGLAYTNPRLTGAALSRAYAALDEEQGACAPTASRQVGPAWLRRLWRSATHVSGTARFVERGPVLDVGCGSGDLMLELRRRGLDVSGVESSPRGLRMCRERGLDVREGAIEDLELEPAAWETIVMSHVLEHIADPVGVLAKLRRALTPHGHLVISVPNCAGAAASAFASDWQGWDAPFHLTHFEPSTLASVLKRAGYVVDRILTRGHPEDITRSIQKRFARVGNPLALRASLFLPAWALGPVALGGEVIAVARNADVKANEARP